MMKRGFKKKTKKLKSAILLIIIIVVILLAIFIFPKFTGRVTKEQKKQVRFYFYDEGTNCSLNGYVFSDSRLIGKTYEGYFNLTYENYMDNFNNNTNISLFGILGSCFNNYLFFDKYWESFEIKEYYFSGDSIFNFKTKINYHNPTRRELTGFVQPWKVKWKLNDINIRREDVLEDLSEINTYLNKETKYLKDWDFNNETNYWQTPEETLEFKTGDCEDFSTTLLSLILAYNLSLNCYNIIFQSHVTTFCHIKDYYIYYDQEKTELKKQIKNEDDGETKSELLELKQEYFEYYGINETETKVCCAFNDQQFIEFKYDKDFIDWQYSLGKKQEFDLFTKLGQETTKIQEKYPTPEEIELRTEKPAEELSTLKGFFVENFTLIFVLGFVLIVLVIILIRINIKK